MRPIPLDEPRQPPAWSARASAALARANASVRVIASTTPLNLRAEIARLEVSFERGRWAAPRFLYASPADLGPLRKALDELARSLEHEGELGWLFAGRAHELAAEATLCEAAGTPRLWTLARLRFARRDAWDDRADALAASWIAEDREECATGGEVRSDDSADPRSLLRRMERAVGVARLPVRVFVNDNLASLAATGDGIVHVVGGRWLGRADVERTVIHEIEGHARPRHTARGLDLGVFSVGTASGLDDQEGRALAIERRRGLLCARRRRELGMRHLAARSVEHGADFVATARLLLSLGASVADALRVASRVHRGGGLAREVVYLPALLRVEAAIAVEPWVDEVLSCGRVAVAAARTLAPWTRRALLD